LIHVQAALTTEARLIS